jgi:3-methyladenine DNA glycosylase AlkD
MQELEALGSAQTRNIYARHGISNKMFGLSYANLGKLKKKYKGQHDLGLELWATDNHDAKILATMILDARRLEQSTLESWSQQLGNYVIADAFSGLVAKSQHTKHLMKAWLTSDDEWQGQVAWNLVNVMASNKKLSDEVFDDYLSTIETSIHKQHNRVKHAMNMALISIGIRSPALEQGALKVAKAIGRVDVDHGQTGCTTPEVSSYIKRTLARKGYLHKSA